MQFLHLLKFKLPSAKVVTELQAAEGEIGGRHFSSHFIPSSTPPTEERLKSHCFATNQGGQFKEHEGFEFANSNKI